LKPFQLFAALPLPLPLDRCHRANQIPNFIAIELSHRSKPMDVSSQVVPGSKIHLLRGLAFGSTKQMAIRAQYQLNQSGVSPVLLE